LRAPATTEIDHWYDRLLKDVLVQPSTFGSLPQRSRARARLHYLHIAESP
jgi:hypothetical protein